MNKKLELVDEIDNFMSYLVRIRGIFLYESKYLDSNHIDNVIECLQRFRKTRKLKVLDTSTKFLTRKGFTGFPNKERA